MKRSRVGAAGALCILLADLLCSQTLAAAFSNQNTAPLNIPQRQVGATAATPQPSVDAFLKWDSLLKQLNVTNGTPEAEFTFYLTNTSPATVVVSNVETSCHCTIARLPEEPWEIAPGAHGEIDVTVDLAGAMGTLIKTITVHTDKGEKVLYVRLNILPRTPDSPLSSAERENNVRLAMADRQAVFKGDCAQCHVEPTGGKTGQALYQSACGICHESKHRATFVPNLRTLPQEKTSEFWRNWIAHGKPGSLMPAFAKSDGGILNQEQIDSLVAYLSKTIPSKPAAQAVKTSAIMSN